MKSILVFVIALIVAIGLPLTAMGQEKKDAGAVNITGCLNKGADADHYVMKEDKRAVRNCADSLSRLTSMARSNVLAI